MTRHAMTTPTVETALVPVLCIDCKQYVPFGWVVYGTQQCSGTTRPRAFGHRVRTEVYDHLFDVQLNKGESPT